jgi:hypothetical protein
VNGAISNTAGRTLGAVRAVNQPEDHFGSLSVQIAVVNPDAAPTSASHVAAFSGVICWGRMHRSGWTTAPEMTPLEIRKDFC